MRAYEAIARVEPNGRVALPENVARQVAPGQTVRLIVFLDEAVKSEDEAWKREVADQFLAGYDDGDAIYDRIE